MKSSWSGPSTSRCRSWPTQYGNVVHLHERDCSLQRRFQKVVEFTPAFSVDEKVRQALCADAVKIAKAVGYVNAGTVEFLVDNQGHHYFIEMNPRIQVEHTVTEMVTGVDLVRAQLLIASGKPLSDPEIGITCQEDVRPRGYAIQCRVTTEDPANNFRPRHRQDHGLPLLRRLRHPSRRRQRLLRRGHLPLLRLPAGQDHLLRQHLHAGACHKALRALSETRVRGVKTNIAFIANILTNPVFQAGQCYTKFIDETPELFDISESRKTGPTSCWNTSATWWSTTPRPARRCMSPPGCPRLPGEIPAGFKQYLDRARPRGPVPSCVLERKAASWSATPPCATPTSPCWPPGCAPAT